MYINFKSIIDSGRYELSNMLKKIDTIWIQGDITDEQRHELMELAQGKAKPENSHAPLQKQIDVLFEKDSQKERVLDDVLKRLIVLEGGEVSPEEPLDEYPEWYPWNGVGPIPWQLESKCTHNGIKYISGVPNNIWEPGAVGVYDNIWAVVEE